MSLIYQNHELSDLMKHFYILTGLKIGLFDERYNGVFAYPECTPFCAAMRENPEFLKCCCDSDRKSFETCKKTQSLVIYKCHAGLIECTVPIMRNNTVIGYIMFGQVSDSSDKTGFRQKMSEQYPGKEIAEKIKKIKFKSNKQLFSAAKLLEICISYILEKNILTPSRIRLFNSIEAYIDEHLSEDLKVEVLCKHFDISRTKLYTMIRNYIPGGIAEYIKDKRLTKAAELLTATTVKVGEISQSCGFTDYNYFTRNFRKKYSCSPTQYRKNHAS